MAAKITFFPVGNGDMTLITLADKTTVLVDINIRDSADIACDVSDELRSRLNTDSNDRPYVDAFLLSHPDQDHCRGLQKNFHLGSLDDYNDEPGEEEEKKIVIRELWSSPRVFKRSSGNNPLCKEAKEFNKEAKRRAKICKGKEKASIDEGDRIKMFGKDEDNKTDGLEDFLVRRGQVFSEINGTDNENVEIRVLGPLAISEIEEDEENIGKNHSSVILQFSIAAESGQIGDGFFLCGGDAEVVIWEKIWEENKEESDHLKYDILLAPHHCSWHTLSHDSWKDSDDPKPSNDAKSALSQAEEGANIVSSSQPIKDDDNDPPCVGAKEEYEAILAGKTGSFTCTDEYPDEDNPQPLEFIITTDGPQRSSKKKASIAAAAGLKSTTEPRTHG